MDVSLSCDRYQVTRTLLIVILANIYFVDAGEWLTFRLMNSTNTPVQSIVIETYSLVKSSTACAMKCVHLDVQSFFYLPDSSICYCNNQTDSSIVEEATGSMVYGFLVHPAIAQECQDLYDEGFRTDGEFTTSSGNQENSSFTSLGWVVFQSRFDGSEEFRRNWTEYVLGFGNTTGEFWLGLEALHQMTKAGCELHVYLEAEPDNPDQAKGFARYANFSIGDASSKYTLHLNGFSGNVGDSLKAHDGRQFSTCDVDNDNDPLDNCALKRGGGWWFAGSDKGPCARSNLNGMYLNGRQSYKGIRWKYPWGGLYSLLRTEMAFKC